MQSKIIDFIPPYNDYYGEIYIVTNLLNGKQYVGQTTRNKKKTHLYYGGGKYVKRATKKHDKENFKREQIETCSNKFELNNRERYWIKKLNTLVPNGYNIGKGGRGSNSINGKIKYECDNCGKENKQIKSQYNNHNYHFCNKKCLYKFQKGENHPCTKNKVITFKCEHCDKEKTIQEYEYNKNEHHFCSQKCHHTFKSINLTNKQFNLLSLLQSNDLFIRNNKEQCIIRHLFKYGYVSRKKEYNYDINCKTRSKQKQYKYSITDLGKKILNKNKSL